MITYSNQPEIEVSVVYGERSTAATGEEGLRGGR
jgi:hypothetical protein